jgi:hypothetical protein
MPAAAAVSCLLGVGNKNYADKSKKSVAYVTRERERERYCFGRCLLNSVFLGPTSKRVALKDSSVSREGKKECETLIQKMG